MNHLFRKLFKNHSLIKVFRYLENDSNVLRWVEGELELQFHLGNIKSPKRRYEIAISQYLLKQEGIRVDSIAEGGRRVTTTGYVSLSHDNSLFTFYTSLKPCGIDIQQPRQQLMRIRNKFTTEVEVRMPNENAVLVSLCKIWAAKEAIFKYAPFGGVSFIEDITLYDILDNYHWQFHLSNAGETEIINIGFREIGDSWLAFTLID